MHGKTLRTNFLINTSGAALRVVVALVTVPIYVHAVGSARYGIVAIFWAFVGYSGFLDFGLTRASANALSKMRDEPQAHRARAMVTALCVNLALGLCGGGGLFFLADVLLGHFVSAPAELRPEIARALPWIAAMIPATLVSAVCIGAMESRERFATANAVQVLTMTLGQVTPTVLALLISPSLVVIVPSIACVGFLGFLLSFGLAYRQEGPLRLSDFDRGIAGGLLRYGGWVTVSSIVHPILTSFGQMLIGTQLGVVAVAHYAVAMTLVVRSQMVPAALARALFPRLSILGPVEADALAVRAVASLAWGYGAVCAPAIVLTPVFFRYWIGTDFAVHSAPIAEILFLGAWIVGLAYIPHGLLQAQGRPDVAGKIHAAEIFVFLSILWGLTRSFGLEGAAASWGLSGLLDVTLLWWASRLPIACALRAAPPIFILAASIVIARLVGPNLLPAVASAAAVGLTSAVAAIVMADDLRQAVRLPFWRQSTENPSVS